VAVVEAVVVVEVAVGGDRMRGLGRLFAVVLVVAGLLVRPVQAATPQSTYATPDAAVTALVAALKTHNPTAIGAVLGPGSEALVSSGDRVKDRQENQRFLDAYAEHHALVADGTDQMVLHVGQNDWPMPIPLVQHNGRWHFDSHEGAQQIVDRRIGRNEIAAIRVCLAYVDAQKAYFDLFKQATGAGAYAQRLVSTPGNYDGLYWPSVTGIPESPLTPLLESAVDEGYPGEVAAGKSVPYQGYFYRVLTRQGTSAPGGARSYIQNGKMVGGFALLAWPAIYGASGVMTFIVNQDGVVFQDDLGRDTAARAARITAFDPGLDWTRIDVSRQ